ncbi:hypothetical protein [Burkholderia oklahomensis]|uniref:hypothetical protein n=1 Tax=Burkholderia oklahomensis TaxID=342113 RepID=UPI00016A8A28|nr:hypothetical protein [Burkholderia oklahomensis]AJX35741.1 hypothetical protein BG90_4236 [Burkholderia oklahomensis C6786]AOI48023.1 hypothetical protein WI23_19135 [Burkholderia oklahomensis C6786]KUY50107.1 hypothetical protein WI23_02840 [Burkholderia oklahomensis C6786]MBI0363862.1 hypothetical protein [Burkholderia oklahomensis]SUY27989.1 Uncharacterised protein [Burkholderia oklahomensis]
MTRASGLALAAAVLLLGLAAAGWRYGLLANRDRAAAVAVAPAAVVPDRAQPVPPPPPAPPSRPLVKALPPVKVKPGGTSWSPDPATTLAPVEAQRGAPDIPGAQPLHPPAGTSP